MVQITRREVMRPPPALACGGGRRSPLTAFDRASTDGYIPAVYAWNAPAPDNSKVIEGLLATVARYPHLAGRFGVDDAGRRCFVLNDAGVLVMEAEADGDLADALAHDVSAHVNELYPKADKVELVDQRRWSKQNSLWTPHLQVTRTTTSAPEQNTAGEVEKGSLGESGARSLGELETSTSRS